VLLTELLDGQPSLLAIVAPWQPIGDCAASADALAQLAAFGCLVPRRTPATGSLLVDIADRLRLLDQPPKLVAALADLAATASRHWPGRPASVSDCEQFLTAYDARQRRSHGAFYTPLEVVRAQVRWADQLVRQIGFGAGLATPDVLVIDPAMGTGNYLLEAVRACGPIRMIGRELMPGPCAAAAVLLSTALTDADAAPVLSWTDALDAPLPADDAALRVCLGNPPYARGDASSPRTAELLGEAVAEAVSAGHGGDVKNLYNRYVEFWCWALREVFEARPDRPGLVSFVTASSYLAGDAFVGLRKHLRRCCDAIWLVDLGGEGRGARQDANVFAIQSPVVIAVALRRGPTQADQPAEVRYRRLHGTRSEKLAQLAQLTDLAGAGWSPVSGTWSAPFLPAAPAEFLAWPALTELLPWQHSGVQPKRTWPIAPQPSTLKARWSALLRSDDRAAAMRATADRTPHRAYASAPAGGPLAPPLASLPSDAPAPAIVPYAVRSFDRQWLLADGRLLSRPRPALWQVQGPAQRYFATSLSLPLGAGPALTVSVDVPDLHVFCGRGAKDILPLYRDVAGQVPNVAPGLLAHLSACFGRPVAAEELAGYVFGVLAHPGYTTRFHDALSTAPPHVPLTATERLFAAVAQLGGELLQLQTDLPTGGTATCTVPVSSAADDHPANYTYDPARRLLRVGEGEFQRVAPEVFGFEVSGLKAVPSWLGYRLAAQRGRHEAPLDAVSRLGWPAELTTALLQLLWTLEATLARYPALDALLARVIDGPLLHGADLPPVPDWCRAAPDRAAGQPELDFDER